MAVKFYLWTVGILMLIVLALGILLATSWKVSSFKSDAVQEGALEANTRAAEVHAREQAKVYRGKEKAIEQVREVAERHPEWADEPVPDDVADILRDPADPARSSH